MMDIPNGLLLKFSYLHNGFLQHFEINSIQDPCDIFGNFWICSSVLPRKKSSPRVSTRLWWFKITGDVSCWWSGILCRFIHSSRSLWQEWRCWKTIEGAILEGEILIDWCRIFSPDKRMFQGKKTGMFVPRSFWKKDLLLRCNAITTMTHYHCLWLSQSYIQFPNTYCFIQNLFR